MKAPLPSNESERLANLYQYDILDSIDEAVWNDIAFLASQICDTPMAAISFVDKDRQWFKAQVGLDTQQTSRDVAFCAHAILQDYPMEIRDSLKDERFADNPLVLESPTLRFYAGAQIMSPEGYALGSLCVLDQKPRALTQNQLKSLESLSRQVSSLLQLRLQNQFLDQARIKAEEVTRTKSEFLANMSHELRTPLNAILGFSELLKEEAEEDGNTNLALDLSKIYSAGEHLLQLINDILDLSKIEAGKMNLYIEKGSLTPLLATIQTTIEPLVQKNQNTLIIDWPQQAQEFCTDQQKLKQILYNLLSNACKFTRQGKIYFRVRRVETDSVPHWEFEIEDTGIGMRPEVLNRIFESFSQADNSTTRQYGGTGLGLTLSRKFAQMMGGQLSVVSQENKGSAFTLTLPEMSDLTPLENIQFEQMIPENNPVNHPLILSIDDDPRVHELISRIVENSPMHHISALSGKEGLEKAQKYLPNMITLDVMMPDVDGWHVLKSMRDKPELRDIPILMLTIVDDQLLGSALGATEIIAKPIQPSALKTKLASYLQAQIPEVILVDAACLDDALMQRLVAHPDVLLQTGLASGFTLPKPIQLLIIDEPEPPETERFTTLLQALLTPEPANALRHILIRLPQMATVNTSLASELTAQIYPIQDTEALESRLVHYLDGKKKINNP